MAELDFDKRRAERGAAEPHTVRFGGEVRTLPASLSMETMAKLGQVLAEAAGISLEDLADAKQLKLDANAMLTAFPKLLEVFADAFGDWIRELDDEEFLAVFGLYNLDVSMGEPPAS